MIYVARLEKPDGRDPKRYATKRSSHYPIAWTMWVDHAGSKAYMVPQPQPRWNTVNLRASRFFSRTSMVPGQFRPRSFMPLIEDRRNRSYTGRAPDLGAADAWRTPFIIRGIRDSHWEMKSEHIS